MLPAEVVLQPVPDSGGALARVGRTSTAGNIRVKALLPEAWQARFGRMKVTNTAIGAERLHVKANAAGSAPPDGI